MKREVLIDQAVAQLARLGVGPGDVLLVHTAFTRVNPLERGPLGLVEALTRAVGPNGTIVMPAWPDAIDGLYDPERTPSDLDLGVVASVFWQLPDVRRSTHVQAFAARGPDADRILMDALPLPPHRAESPVGRVHELDGKILLLGVNHDANTTIHLAEVLAEVPYGRELTCQGFVDGVPHRITYRENDHCCRRFRLVDSWLDEAGAQVAGTVGHAEARLVRSAAVVNHAGSALHDDPLVFLHDRNVGCSDCNAARDSLSDDLPLGLISSEPLV